MPKLNKSFFLEVSVEQFLNACSYIELQEINMRLDVYLRKAEHEARRQDYRNGRDPDLILPPHTLTDLGEDAVKL